MRRPRIIFNDGLPAPEPETETQQPPVQVSGPPAQAVRFIEAMFGGGRQTFQVIDDDRDRQSPNLSKVIHGTIEEVWPKLQEFSDLGAGIFVCPNKTTGRGRRIAANITEVRYVFADLDGSPLGPVLEYREPHMIVSTSPGRFHCYYRVEGVPLTDFEACQKFLIQKFNADKQVCDLPRVMRLPGYAHQKRDVAKGLTGQKFPVTIHSMLPNAPPLRGTEVERAEDPFTQHSRNATRGKKADVRFDLDEYKAALRIIPAEGYDRWFKVGRATFTHLGEEGGDLFHEWSSTDPGYSYKDTETKWRNICTTTRGETTCASVYELANEIDPQWDQAIETEGGLPTVKVKAGKMHDQVEIAEKLLLKSSEDEVYQQVGNSELLRPVVQVADASNGRRTHVAQMISLVPRYVTDRIGHLANWKRFDKKQGWLRIDPPPQIATGILSKFGHWTFPTIAGVITTQTMRPDGSLLTEPGFDPATRLLLVKPPPLPAMPENPTREDALEALDLLKGLLTEFPFVDKPSEAVALSGLMSPVVRGAFDHAPLHCSDAPKAGTGKSYMWDVVASVAIGDSMPVVAAVGSDMVEMDKRLGTVLMTGQPLVSLDNINGTLRSSLLCQILTQGVVDYRVLGENRQVKIHTGSVTMFATGNNIAVASDLCRRTLLSKLDTETESPETRSFVQKPVDLVLAGRGRYVAAVLTICRAYHLAGRPGRAQTLGSFEGWSDLVRSSLMWLGEDDPVKTMEASQDDDPDKTARAAVLEEWGAVIGIGYGSRKPIAQVAKIANETDGGGYAPRWPELQDALTAACGQTGRRVDAGAVGLWARQNKKVLTNGMRLVNEAGGRAGVAKWWVERGSETRQGACEAEQTAQTTQVQDPSE